MTQQSWTIKRESKFIKQFKLIGHARQIKVLKAIEDLVTSRDPSDFGVYKASIRAFAYELGKGDRMIFDIDYPNHAILLLRVCDHKSAYGMD